MGDEIIVVTTNEVPGYKTNKVLGLVSGITVRTRGLGGRFMASLESLVGGEVSCVNSARKLMVLTWGGGRGGKRNCF